MLVQLACLAVKARSDRGITVSTESGERLFALSEVNCVTFGDDQMTIVQNDGSEVSFPNSNGWTIRFVTAETDGIQSVTPTGGSMQVYDASGARVGIIKEVSELTHGNYPKGVYMVKCNGKTIKVKL